MLSDNIMARMSMSAMRGEENVIRMRSQGHLKIQWKENSINGYLKFLDEVDQFQLLNNQDVEYLVPMIEESLRETIINDIFQYYGAKFNTQQAIYKISAMHLNQVVQLMYVPKSKSHFLSLL